MTGKKLGYLGPAGTFSEEAAREYNRDGALQPVECPTIAAVLAGVASGDLQEGLVPLENSLEGSVGVTLDLLAREEGIYICREMIHPVRHCLMAAPGVTLAQVKAVYSHPHALGQCREYLERHLPRAACHPVESTAAAARLVAGQPGAAAVAPRRAAALFGLCLLAEDIQDNGDSETRFVVTARRDHPPTGQDKTSLVLATPDGPGSLYRVLGYFARHAVNLTRIESRPARRSLGDWFFFIDCQGHRCDPPMQALWRELSAAVPFLKLLGSYPVHDRRKGPVARP